MITVGTQLKLWGVVDTYKVLHVTNENRALISFDGGLVVAVDRAPNGTWDLSGTPNTPEETAFIEAQPGFGQTTVDVVKDGES